MTNNDNSKMNEIDFLFKQYEILLGLMQYHHARWNDHLKAFLTFVSIIAAGTGLLSKNHTDLFVIKFLSFLGFIICWSAIITMNRIRNDTRLKFSQINRLEEKIAAYSEKNSLHFIQHSIEAKDFFKGISIDKEDFFPKSIININNLSLIVVIFVLFAFYFLGGMFGLYFLDTAKNN